MLVDGRASTVVVLIEGDALIGAAQKLRQSRFDRPAAQVPAIMLEKVERAEHGGMVVTAPSGATPITCAGSLTGSESLIGSEFVEGRRW